MDQLAVSNLALSIKVLQVCFQCDIYLLLLDYTCCMSHFDLSPPLGRFSFCFVASVSGIYAIYLVYIHWPSHLLDL